MIKLQLLRDNSVQFVYGGKSSHPVVNSGDGCVVVPVDDHHELIVGDIVFCEVQLGNKILVQKILYTCFWHQTGCISPKRYFYVGNSADPPMILL